MSFSPNSSKVIEAVEINYLDMKRSSSMRWISVNIVLFFVFAYDLWAKCPGYTSALHYVELCCAGVVGANVVLHARRLSGRAGRVPPARPRGPPAPPACRPPTPTAELTLCARPDSSPPPSPPSAPPSPPAPDRFIADAAALAAYLRSASPPPEEPWTAAPAPHLRTHYQLASLDTESSAEEREQLAPPAWRRLTLDPARLAQWTLNMRRWLSATIVERVARALDEAESAGEAGGGGLAAAALEPYLRPFADRRYVAARVRQLAAGGCLGAYRWCGGGADWSPARPSDAELLLHLFLAYLEALAPGGPAGGAGPELRLEARAPPHASVVLAGGERLEAARGRDNVLHSLLLLLAAAAAREPPALRRLPLGPPGLNMLWIIGR